MTFNEYIYALAELCAKIATVEVAIWRFESKYYEELVPGGIVHDETNEPEEQEPITVFVKSNISAN